MTSAWDDDAPTAAGVNGISIPLVEDDDTDVKDNWDDDDDDKQIQCSVPQTQKAKQQKKDKMADDYQSVPLTDEERQKQKIENEKRVRIEDLELVKTFLGVAQRSITVEPTTRSEFDNLALGLADSLSTFSSSEHFSDFIDKLVRELAVNLPHDVLSKLSISFSALSQEKLRQQQHHKKSKKKRTAVKLTVEKDVQDAESATNVFGGDDFEADNDDAADDFDFM